MSIENNLASIAKSLEAIALALTERKQSQLPLEVVRAPALVSAPTPTPQPVAVPVPLTVPVPQQPMEVPQFAQPSPLPQGIPLPFSDAKTLLGYVMNKYKNLGPVKGALIQGVLAELGVKNVNEVKPEQYENFYLKVEAIV